MNDLGQSFNINLTVISVMHTRLSTIIIQFVGIMLYFQKQALERFPTADITFINHNAVPNTDSLKSYEEH